MGEAVEVFPALAHCNARVAFVENRCLVDKSFKPDYVFPLPAVIHSVTRLPAPEFTYCLTVADNHTMMCGERANIVCANCDDPHNCEEVESDSQRASVLDWWAELSSTRLNDPKESPIVVIMQRLHEQDVSGVILSGEDSQDWTHLMLPMRFDRNRRCTTVSGAE